MSQKGITLIALIITIIILLILAGITIGVVTGENSLINQAEDAKENAEIASEKEAIDNATIEAMGKNKYGNLEENEFQKALDNQTNGKATVIDIGESFEVFFTESKRYYGVDKNGNIGDFVLAVTDPYPGDITKDENGNTLTGNSEEDAYQINCIEDLVAFSNMVNGVGKYFEGEKLTDVNKAYTMTGKYIVLTRDLNFKSSASYVDSRRTDFGDINGDDSDENTLIIEMTTKMGFRPIGRRINDSDRYFLGSFNGNNHKIENIYIDYSNAEETNAYSIGKVAGLFGRGNSNSTKISNLEISGTISGNGHTGGIIGESAKSVENCINRANIKGNNMSGGIIGNGTSTKIVNCKNYGKIELTNATWGYGGAGGIAGNSNEVMDCVNYGEIKLDTVIMSSTAGGYGGIVGTASGTVDKCINYGNIIIENQTTSKRSGGIAGALGATDGSMKNCENNGEVKGYGQVGGIIGELTTGDWGNEHIVKIENNINRGKLQNSKTAGATGGIVGYIGTIYKSYTAYFRNCCNMVELETGIVGNIGASTGINDFQLESIYDCNDTHIKTQNSNVTYTGEVTKKTIEEMKTQEFIDLLNSYKDESGNYPSDWKKW